MKYDHNTDIYISFYNDRILEAISASEIAEPFTYVPIKAAHQELIGGNVMMFGNMTEGYPVSPINCDISFNSESITSKYAEVNIAIYAWRSPMDIYYTSPSTEARFIYALVVNLPSRVYVGATYVIRIKAPAWATYKQISYVAQPGDTIFMIQATLTALMQSAGIVVISEEDIGYSTGLTNVILIEKRYQYSNGPIDGGAWDPYPYTKWNIYGRITTTGTYNATFPQLKRGSKHGYGIVYKDDFGRQNSVAKTDDMILNIPFFNEVIYYGGAIGAGWMESGINTIINPTFKISSLPPSWASFYEIVYCGNLSMEVWLQIRAASITTLANNRFQLDIQSCINEIRTTNPRWQVPDWNWDAGDRLRLIGTIDTSTGAFTEYDTLYDYSIEAVYGGIAIGGDFLFQAVNKPAGFAGTQSNVVMEIYRPRRGMGTSVFYGSGMVFGIGIDSYGNRYHKGDVDQVLDSSGFPVTPAEIINTAFDSLKFERLNYKPGDVSAIQPFWAESNMPSDWWPDQLIENRLTSNGFPFLYDISQKQSILTKRLRHGGYLLPGTQINDIAHFTYADFVDLAEKDGDIIGLREIGFTLKVLQFHKETSIYVNRIQTFNPDGTEQFTLIDRLVGTVRPEETIFGSQHPDSVMVEGRNIYYWDNIEGEVIRSAPNGQMPLSGPEYKMSRWFKDLVQWIRTSGGAQKLKVRFGYNVDHDELWCSFVIDSTVYGAIFSETKKRWITRIDQITDAYVHAGEFFAHLYNQKLWVMNVDEGQAYLTWAGVPTTAELELVSNIDPKKNKVFNAIAIYSDHELQIPAGYIRIPREASVALMESFVAIWEEKEGIFYGGVLKDQNSPGSWVSVNDVTMNGREMRGRYCYIKLLTSERTEKVKLDSVIVFSTPSERNV